MQTKVRYLVSGCLLLTGCLLQSGCADLVRGSAEDALYHQDVQYYEGRGVSHQGAERAATEDETLYDTEHPW
jgi:uncharacterized protein YfaT (DUF1175 family)